MRKVQLDHRTSHLVYKAWDEAEALVHELPMSERQRRIIATRWVEHGRRYERMWRSQRGRHYALRVPIIFGAATVPVLASLDAAKAATVVVGLAVAVLTGLDSFFSLGTRWQQYRRAATEITFAGWELLEEKGKYLGKTPDEAFHVFIEHLEELNKRVEIAYINLLRLPEKADRNVDSR
jgi:hypothetical protein